MIDSLINVSANNYFDDSDNPFEPSNDNRTNILTHNDWKGLPWTEEPTDETTSATDDDDDWANFDTDDEQPEALPITKMPDITPEEKEICEELSHFSINDTSFQVFEKKKCL